MRKNNAKRLPLISFLFSQLILCMFLFCGLAFGEDAQKEKKIMATELLVQRGKQLRADVEQTWKRIIETRGQLRPRNDISATVAKYFPIGSSFEDAEVVLFSAGFNVVTPPALNFPSNSASKYGLVGDEESTKFGVRPSQIQHTQNMVAVMKLEETLIFSANSMIALIPESSEVGQRKIEKVQGIIIYNSL